MQDVGEHTESSSAAVVIDEMAFSSVTDSELDMAIDVGVWECVCMGGVDGGWGVK